MTRVVLVADDHPLVREVLRTMLESRGFGVVLATDGAAAIAACEHTRFDAVLIDMEMPGMTGLELLRELRRGCEQRGCPFRAALMTGVASAELLAAAAEAGASGVLTKPFPIASLVAMVERVAGGSPEAGAAA